MEIPRKHFCKSHSVTPCTPSMISRAVPRWSAVARPHPSAGDASRASPHPTTVESNRRGRPVSPSGRRIETRTRTRTDLHLTIPCVGARCVVNRIEPPTLYAVFSSITVRALYCALCVRVCRTYR